MAAVGPNPKKAPSGLIHDWLGAAFIPGVTSVTYWAWKVNDSAEAKDRYSTVLLYKSAFLKMALDADYESRYVHVDDRRIYTTSRATRIQEIGDYGSPAQRLLPEDEGNGIQWRVFSISLKQTQHAAHLRAELANNSEGSHVH